MPLPREYYFSDTPVLKEELNLEFLEKSKWREWDKTGFKLRQQLQKLAIDYQTKLSEGKSPQSAISEWTQETSEDVEGFWFEYLCQHLVLPIKIEKKFIDGKWEIVCPRYSNKPLTETVLPEERNGAAKEGISKLTEFLTSAPENSMAILISPSGWSGLKTDDGERITYTETQIYVYKINLLGKVEAITLRTDCSLAQNIALYRTLFDNNLPVFKSSQTDQSIIEEMVGNPILIDGTESSLDLEDVIKTLELIKDSKYALKERTFAELWEHFQKRHEISRLEEQGDPQADNQRAKAVIGKFQRFMENYEYLPSESIEDIAEELENTLRQLYRIKTRPQSVLNVDQFIMTEMQRQREMVGIQKLLGCTGTISSISGSLSTAFGLRSYTKDSSSRYSHCGRCSGKRGEFKDSEGICANAIKIS